MMSTIGSAIETSLLQTAQAQRNAVQARDKERAKSDTARKFQDQIELRVAGMEDSDAIRKLPHNDSEQAEDEHRREAHEKPIKKDGEEPKHIDVTG